MTSSDNTTPEGLLIAFSRDLGQDILMALRLCYYVEGKSIVPDHLYDQAEKEYTNRPETDETGPLMFPGSDLIESYSPAQRALAVYLMFVLDRQDPNRPPDRPC